MKKRLLVFMLAICMVFTMIPAISAAGDYEGKIVILHSNDVHGAIQGYAYIAGLKNYYEGMGADVILADAGDYSQGTPYVSVSKGATAVEMMNEAGYDVATIGNHELDYGFAQLQDNLKKANFKVLCADVFDSKNNPVFDTNTIIEFDGVKVGFFGLETPEAQTKANPALIKGLNFIAGKDLYKAAQAQVDDLEKKGADVVICLAHLGVDDESEPNRSYDLYDNVEGIDMVIDGHSHTIMDKGVNNEPIQSTGTAFENVGMIVIDKANKRVDDNKLIKVDDSTPIDADVLAAADAIIADIDNLYGQKFAETTVRLNGDRDPGNRTEETNLGDLITDSMLWKATENAGSIKVDSDNIVAVTNGGGIRASINAGDITRKDVNTVLPFGNTIAVVYVKGSELLEALEASTYSTPGAVGAFPQIAGMQIEIDTTRTYDANDITYPGSTYFGPKTINRVTIKNINGKDFDEDETYAVVTNNFLAAGGDTYYAFASATEQFDTGIPMDEALMEYITTVLESEITEGTYGSIAGRIAIVTSHNVSSEIVPAVDADCENDGHIAYYPCLDEGCDAKFADPNGDVKYKESEVVIEALGHELELINVKEPTCNEKGYTGDKKCKICDEIIQEGEYLDALDHDIEIVNAKKATCTEDGYTGDHKCKLCDEIIEKGKVISASGHKDEDNDGICDVCKEKMPDGSTTATGDATDNSLAIVLFLFTAMAAPYAYNYNKKKRTVNAK